MISAISPWMSLGWNWRSCRIKLLLAAPTSRPERNQPWVSISVPAEDQDCLAESSAKG